MSSRTTLSDDWNRFQGELFPALVEEVGPLPENLGHLVRVLDLVEVERFVATCRVARGRPLKSRQALARAIIEAIRNLPDPRPDRQGKG